MPIGSTQHMSLQIQHEEGDRLATDYTDQNPKTCKPNDPEEQLHQMRRVITMMRVIVALLTLIMVGPLLAADAEQERLANSAEALDEILNIPDALPKELLNKAECVAVMPSVKKFAIGIGGSYGRGVLVCRTGNNFTGPWGAAAMYRLEGANIGFQLGGQATDFLLLVINPKGVEAVLLSKVELGADASVAGGPKGPSAMAATDAFMRP